MTSDPPLLHQSHAKKHAEAKQPSPHPHTTKQTRPQSPEPNPKAESLSSGLGALRWFEVSVLNQTRGGHDHHMMAFIGSLVRVASFSIATLREAADWPLLPLLRLPDAEEPSLG